MRSLVKKASASSDLYYARNLDGVTIPLVVWIDAGARP